jgi:2'-5' RNA ligase
MSTRRRLFFALWPDEACRVRLQAVAAPLLARVPGRGLAPADWHVTLCFLGAVEPAMLEPLQRGAGALAARGFELPLEQIRYWREAHVIAAMGRVVPAPALQLAEGLREMARALGLAPDDKPLRPHVTLMRGVTPPLWREARALDGGPAGGQPVATAETSLPLPADLTLRAEAFTLAESVAGPAAPGAGTGRYVELARWPLQH